MVMGTATVRQAEGHPRRCVKKWRNDSYLRRHILAACAVRMGSPLTLMP